MKYTQRESRSNQPKKAGTYHIIRLCLTRKTQKFEKSKLNKVLNELLTHSIITLKEEVYDYFKPKLINSISITESIDLESLKNKLIKS